MSSRFPDPLPRIWSPESRVGGMQEGRRGLVVAFLVSGADRGMTGDTIYVDGSLHDMA